MLRYILPLIGWSYIRFVAATSKIITHGGDIPARLKAEKKPFIFAFWHGRSVFHAYARRMDDIDVLISQSKDGEYIARTIALFGMGSVRGSTSRGGSRALVELKRSLEKGRLVGIAPDGPRGPVGKVQPGVVFIAQKTGVPVVPLSFAARRKKILYNWDEFHVPYPFSRIAVTYGEPYYITKDMSAADSARELERRMEANTVLADELV